MNILVRKREDYGNMDVEFKKDNLIKNNGTILDGSNKENSRGLIHKVEKGETLYKISKMYDVRLVDVLRENPYVNVYNLQVGDEISIPTELFDDEDKRYYNVRVGDTVFDIVNNIDTDVKKLFEFNKELYNLVVPLGTVIRIPNK